MGEGGADIKSNKKTVIISAIIVVCIVLGIFFDVWGSNPTGYLLMPYGRAPGREEFEEGIYIMSIEDEKEIAAFFITEEYEDLRSPMVRDEILYCVGKKLGQNYYAFLKVDEYNEVTEVFKSDTIIHLPTFIDDENIVYIKEREAGTQIGYLYKYNARTKQEISIYENPVDINSKPMVLNDGSIIFVSDNREPELIIKDKFGLVGKIMVRHEDGTLKELVEGKYPLLFQNSKKLIYYCDSSIKILNLTNNKVRTIKKSVSVLETPILSPDEKFIAFYRSGSYFVFGGGPDEFYSIISTSGKTKKSVREYLWGGPKFPRGAEWIMK